MKFLLGTKIGMTSIIDEQGTLIPVTVIQAGPCVVTQVKTRESDGYAAVQIGLGTAKKLNKPATGHFAKSETTPRYTREARITEEEAGTMALGNTFDVSLFSKGDKVKVSGQIKGRGFTGPVKRYGFKGHPASHGHPQQRKVGSIGSTFPQHVIKGMRMAGKYGDTRKSVMNLTVVDVDQANNIILVRGGVPGVVGRLLEIAGN
ncbi:MAG: 50S ribosomal protein L3 [Patescibacteria group bacterium]